jgi:hypothetical protein
MAPQRRYPTLGSEAHDGFSVFKGQNTWSPEKRVGVLPGHGDKGALEFAKFSHFKRLQRQADCRGRCLQFLQYQHIGSVGRIMEDRHAGSLGDNSFQEFQPFPAQFGADAGQPGDVPARSRDAGDEPGANRIGYARDDDGNCASCLFGGQRRRRSWGDDNIRF